MRERACQSPGCQCTHLVCFGGWLDEEVTQTRLVALHRGNEFRSIESSAVVRCPICEQYLPNKRKARA